MKRNAKGLLAVFDNLDLLKQAYQTAEESAGSAEQEQAHYAESVQYSIDRAKASLQELAQDFLSSDLLKGLIEAGNTALQMLDGIVQRMGSIGAIATTLLGRSALMGIFGQKESFVGGLVKNFAQKQLGKELGDSMLGNIAALFQSEDFGTKLGSLGGLAPAIQEQGLGGFLKSLFVDATTEGMVEGAAGAGVEAAMKGAVKGAGETAAKEAVESVAENVGEAAVKGTTEAVVEGVGKTVGEAITESVATEGGEAIAEAGAKVAENVAEKTVGEAVEEAVIDGMTEGVKDKAVSKAMGKTAEKMIEKGAEGGIEGGVGAGLGKVATKKGFAAFGEAFMTAALNPVTLTALAVGAGALTAYAVNKYTKEQTAKRQQQSLATWKEDISSLDEYISKYKELSDQLKDSSLSESARLGVKQDLLDLQKQIVEQYGEEAKYIDLVNGAQERQVELLEQVVQKRAQANLDEYRNDNQKAVNEMSADVSRSLTDTGHNLLTGQTKEMQSFVKEASQIKGVTADIVTDMQGFDRFKLSIDYDDVDSAVEGLGQLSDLLDKGINNARLNPDLKGDLEGIKDFVFSEDGLFGGNEYYEIIKRNRDKVEGMMDEEIFSKDGGYHRVSDIESAIKAYNTAVSSMDVEKIDEASASFDKLTSDFKTWAEGEGIQTYLIDKKVQEFQDGLDKEGARQAYLNEVLQEANKAQGEMKLSPNNPYAQRAKYIDDYIDKLKELNLTEVDIQDIMDRFSRGRINDHDYDLGEQLVIGLSRMLGFNPEDGASLASLLADQGYVQQTGVEDTSLIADISGVTAQYNKAMSAIEAANVAMINSFTGKGLSAGWDEATKEITGDVKTIMDAFSGMDMTGLFEQSANGIGVNIKALNKLQQQQQRITRDGFYKKQKELVQKLAQAELARAQGQDVSGQIQTLKDQLTAVNFMMGAYEGATSAYQSWLEAAEQGSESDIYDNIVAVAAPRFKEMFEANKIREPEFAALLKLFTGRDFSNATDEQKRAAYNLDKQIEGTKYSLNDFLKDGQEGIDNFIHAITQLGEEFAVDSEDGTTATLKRIKTGELARRFGTSEEMVEYLLHAANTYGGTDLHFYPDEIADALDKSDEKIQSLNTKVAEASEGAEHPLTYQVDVDNLEDVESLDSAITDIQSILQHSGDVLSKEQYEAFAELLHALEERKSIFESADPNQYATASIEAIEAGLSAFDQLGTYFEEASSINILLDVEGNEQVQQLAEFIASLPPEVKIGFGLNGDANAQDILDFFRGIYYNKDNIDDVLANTSQRIEEVNQAAENPVTLTVETENLDSVDSLDTAISEVQNILDNSEPLNLNDDQYKAFSDLLDVLIH